MEMENSAESMAAHEDLVIFNGAQSASCCCDHGTSRAIIEV